MSGHTKASDVPLNSKMQRFLLKHLVPKGNTFTHTSLGKPLGSFYIPVESLGDFYKVYTEALENNEDIFLTEKHRHISPVLIDLDLRFTLQGETAQRKYTQDHINQIVECYCDNICEIFEPISERVILYVMEKTSPQIVQRKIKDGIHIVIPQIITKPSAQYVLRNRVMKQLGKLFEEMGATNKVDDIVDEAVIERNNWLMYGSKKPNGEPYKLTRVFECNLVNGLIEDVSDEFKDIQLYDLVQELSIRNKHDEVRIKPEAMDEINDYEKIIECRRRKMETAKCIITDETNNAQNECSNLDEVNLLIDILGAERANSYNDWIKIGWCLRNIDHRLKDKWIDFSRKSPKYRDGECEHLWNHMKTGGLGIGSLHMWAKQDNPIRYAEVLRTGLRRLIYESKTGTHNDVARVIFEMYRYEYVCASIKYKVWYEFRCHRWHQSDSACSLRIKMSNEVWREYVSAARDFSQRAMDSTNPEDQERFHDYAQKLHNIATKLKTTSFKDNVMKECGEMFYIEKFEERLDANMGLIGFENGVFDLDTMEFREGRPEDYITFSTKNNYVAYDPSHNHVAEIRAYLAQVLTRPGVREYVMKLFSTFIHGAIKEQKFYLWTGSGSNSKSKLIELFEKSFGDYCCKFPVTMLTQKRAASNAATSEMARAKGKRFACLQEPSEDEKFNVGYLKEITGGDKIMARALFKEPIEFTPQFKLILCCNHLPAVPSDDGGTWRRIRVVEFTSKFVENPVEENEFPIDLELSQKLEDWKEMFFAMLLEYYKLYRVEGIQEPEDVLACTREYKRQNDHIADFVHNCMEKKDSQFLSLNDAFAELKAWAKDDNIPIKIPTKSELEKYISKNVCKCVSGNNLKGFKGWKLKNRYQIAEETTDGIDT